MDLAKTPARQTNQSKPTPRDQPLEQILTELQITEWDLILIGDGSGSSWGHFTGWACVAVEPGGIHHVFYGGCNSGTVNTAELTAYLNPLLWYLEQVLQDKSRTGEWGTIRNVHIITDSDYSQQQGNAHKSTFMSARSILINSFEMLHRQGIRLHWHHLKRSTAALNRACDALSRKARVLLQGSNLGIAGLSLQGDESDHSGE